MDNETQQRPLASQPPVPKPRSRPKPSMNTSSPGKPDAMNSTSHAKPPVAAKPKLAPKPSLNKKPETVAHHPDDAHELDSNKKSINRKSRPLSVKVTEDGVHNKVANELASILGRPRSSSKGLLSPTAYSSPQPTQVSPPAHDETTPTGRTSTIALVH